MRAAAVSGAADKVWRTCRLAAVPREMIRWFAHLVRPPTQISRPVAAGAVIWPCDAESLIYCASLHQKSCRFNTSGESRPWSLRRHCRKSNRAFGRWRRLGLHSVMSFAGLTDVIIRSSDSPTILAIGGRDESQHSSKAFDCEYPEENNRSTGIESSANGTRLIGHRSRPKDQNVR